MGFMPIGLCVLTVWECITDPASIGDRRLFETRRLIEVLRYCKEETTLYRVGQKPDQFKECITLVCNNIGRRSIYQNVQLFIRSKYDILNVAIFKIFFA